MKRKIAVTSLALSVCLFTGLNVIVAQNPFVTDQFTADPTARVFEGKMYVYPSHDIPTPAEKPGRKDWFCMEDYHVFSSENLSEWTDHGVIVTQKQVPWVDGSSYSMWAPDCVEKNGKYYFYFPANVKKDSTTRGGFGVGVGISDKPYGPFKFESKPIKGVGGIDPCVLMDKDGQSYIYWVARGLSVAKLKDNMLELASEPKVIEGLPKGFVEGPFAFERNGKYYLTFPHVKNKTEELAYCIGDNPMGPFKYCGVIMDESPVGCWTNHQSIVEYKGQWYLFYHHNDLSPKFDKNRSIRVDSLFFNADGTIQKVKPTLRGVGLTSATSKIQIDRYSEKSDEGATVEFIDTTNTFAGWETVLDKKSAWIRYNAVDFPKSVKNVNARVRSSVGTQLQIRLDKVNGPTIAKIVVPKSDNWLDVKSKVKKIKPGKHDLFVTSDGDGNVDIDWVSFK